MLRGPLHWCCVLGRKRRQRGLRWHWSAGQVVIGGLSSQSLATPWAALTLPSCPAAPSVPPFPSPLPQQVGAGAFMSGVTSPPRPPPLSHQVGAGAFMSGVTRLTMALAVIMIEVSSDVHMLLPVLVAVMTVRAAD